MTKKKFVLLLILLIFILSVLNIETTRVSAAEPPAIYIEPASIVDPTLTPGNNFTISIKTDYNGTDIWSWRFILTYSPSVLEGVNVTNGDLITKAKDSSADWVLGTFNNTLGELSLTLAYFQSYPEPVYMTSGPGTLANVTFEVVGTGISNITLEPKTRLAGWTPGVGDYTIPTDIQHGYFENIKPIHDVAITRIDAPAETTIGDIVSINVIVANQGNFTETFNVTAYANTTHIGTETGITLERGNATTLTFDWNTTGVVEGNYTIKAEAEITLDDEPLNNIGPLTKIEVKTVHDVAVISLEAPSEAIIGELVSINVTIANQGHYNENVTLTVYYLQRGIGYNITIDTATANFTLNKGLSQTVPFKWNTTGLDTEFPYVINATATVLKSIENPGGIDEDPGDNIKTIPINLTPSHDVKVLSVTLSSYNVFVGELVNIEVTVQNVGGYNETFEVRVTYDTSHIDTLPIDSLIPENLTSLSFIWNTTDVAPGSYTIKAEAILEGDVNPTNNDASNFVIVKSPFGTIVGNVTDASTGSPIEGASVTAGDYTSTTNADGHYIISDVQPGNYTVTVSSDGYESASQSDVTVVAGETTTMDFELTPTLASPSDIPLVLYVAAAGAAAIILAAIAFYFLKIRKPKPT